jgi:hypothetical protein
MQAREFSHNLARKNDSSQFDVYFGVVRTMHLASAMQITKPKQIPSALRFSSHVSARSHLALKVCALATSASSPGAAVETLFQESRHG